MRPEIIQAILDINRQFYQTFAGPFAATRRRIQPGVRQVLAGLPKSGNWLDLGSGSGALALEWMHQGRTGSYTGLDFSAGLLEEARKLTAGSIMPPGLEINFVQADLMEDDWPQTLPRSTYDGVLCFAALHHLPARETHLRVLRQIRALLAPGGCFIHSNWQFRNSPKLTARIQPWSRVGFSGQDVEPGDTLLDWRYSLPGQSETHGLRYVHLFSSAELSALAQDSGFEMLETFLSDGEGGKLGLYQRWRAI